MIAELVATAMKERHPANFSFIDSVIPISGKVFGEAELTAAVQASLVLVNRGSVLGEI